MPRTPAVTRLTLLPSASRTGSTPARGVRRYRVARLQLVADTVPRSGRFDHLTRPHD